MRKTKAFSLIAAAAFAVTSKVAVADTSLFTTQGDFGGSSVVGPAIDSGFYGFVGGNSTDPNLGGTSIVNSNSTPTTASLAAGQETGWEGWGYYDGAGNIIHSDPSNAGTGFDAQGNTVDYNTTSLGGGGSTINGIGHYSNDFAAAATTGNPPQGYPVTPVGPFNAAGSDPNFGKGYGGNTGVHGSMTIEGYQGKTEGEGYDVLDTGEMISNNPASTNFINALGTGVTMAIDFTAPGGGTTLTADGKNASPYYLLSFGTFDSHGANSLDVNGAGAGWINATTSLAAKDLGNFFDAPGSFVVQHGTGASSYWTGYLPYSYSAALTATFLQMILIVNSDGYSSGATGNVTIGNIRTVSPTWATAGSGSWNQAAVLNAGVVTTQANWVGAGSNGLGVPSGSGVGVTFGDLETGNATVGLDTNQTVGTLNFNSTGDNSTGLPIQYNLAGADSGTGAGGSLIMDNTANSAPAAINDTSGSPFQYITAPVVLNSNTNVTVTGATNTLQFGSDSSGLFGGISGSGSLSVSGPGTVLLSFANTYGGGTTVNAGGKLVAGADNSLPSGKALVNNGTTTIVGNASLSSLTGTGTLAIGTGAEANKVTLAIGSGLATQSGLTINPTATLDITNNHMILSYGATDPASTIYSYLKTGFGVAAVTNAAAWTGPGINSSVANLAGNRLNYGVGYVDGADHVPGAVLPGTSTPLTSGQILIAYALYGDVNLDNLVNATDFAVFGVNFNTAQTGWDKGDFLYNGLINASDFALLGTNFGKAASGVALNLPASDFAALDAFAAANGLSLPSVPEPGSIALLGLAGAGMMSRRRRKI